MSVPQAEAGSFQFPRHLGIPVGVGSYQFPKLPCYDTSHTNQGTCEVFTTLRTVGTLGSVQGQPLELP